MTSVAGKAWFLDPGLKRVLTLLNGDGGEARVVGGAVRNSLMGLDVSDMDIATTLLPTAVQARAVAAGIKCVPTGIKHGTVTLVVDGHPFEVTTLRRDVETDGRHAEVAFTDDWKVDAERRDLTINALYADQEGLVHDHVGGLADIAAANIRFIGDPATRIAEDTLRILRFFRFFAYYGKGRPDAAGIKASAVAKNRLTSLSAERVWSEMKKLLSAEDPFRALLWMRTAGVLTVVLPETEKWGIDAIPTLIEAEQHFGWPAEPLLRLAAIVPPDGERLAAMAERLKLSGAERGYFAEFAEFGRISDETTGSQMDRLLYEKGATGAIASLKLALATALSKNDHSADAMSRTARLTTLLDQAVAWRKPVFPVKGADLLQAGYAAGPDLGTKLAELEEIWVSSGFRLEKADLLAKLAT